MVTRRVSEGNNVFRFRRLRMIGNCFPLAHEELSWIVVSQYKPEAQVSEFTDAHSLALRVCNAIASG